MMYALLMRPLLLLASSPACEPKLAPPPAARLLCRLVATVVIVGFMAVAVSAAPPVSRYFKDPQVQRLVKAAARGRSSTIIRLVKEEKVDVNTIGEEGFTPLAYAMLSLNREGFSTLLAAGADPNVLIKGLPVNSGSLIALAAQGEDPFWLMELMKYKADPNQRTLFVDQSPIYAAIRYNRVRNVKVLVENGADLNYRDALDEPPLRQAAIFQKWEIVLFLLQSGADWKYTNPRGISILGPLESYPKNISVRRSGPGWEIFRQVVEWLDAHGADLSEDLKQAVAVR